MSAPANPADAPLALDDLARPLAASEAEGPRQQLLLDHLGGFDHEALLIGLKDRFDRYWQSDMCGALRLAESFLFAAPHLGARDHRAIAMMARGDALRACGHFSKDLAALEAAERAFREQGDPVG